MREHLNPAWGNERDTDLRNKDRHGPDRARMSKSCLWGNWLVFERFGEDWGMFGEMFGRFGVSFWRNAGRFGGVIWKVWAGLGNLVGSFLEGFL